MDMNNVMKVMKDLGLPVSGQDFGMSCTLETDVRLTLAGKFEEMIEKGDEKAKLVYEAEALHISKDIGQMAVSHKGKVDVIILTGGVAHSKMLTDMIKGYVEFIAPVAVMAGESEMDALALGGLRLLTGKESPQTYTLPVK